MKNKLNVVLMCVCCVAFITSVFAVLWITVLQNPTNYVYFVSYTFFKKPKISGSGFVTIFMDRKITKQRDVQNIRDYIKRSEKLDVCVVTNFILLEKTRKTRGIRKAPVAAPAKKPEAKPKEIEAKPEKPVVPEKKLDTHKGEK